MFRIVPLFFVVILAFSPVAVFAQGEATYPLESSVIVGPGLEGLEITGEPDEHGLIWHIREPQRKFESWVVVAYNAGDQPVSNVRGTLQILSEGQWYLANLDAKDRMLYPPTIKPGEFGFVKMGGIMAKPTPWDDSRIAEKSVNVSGENTIVSLGIEGGEVTSGGYLGTFVNGSNVTVERLTLVVGCVENGNIVDTDFFVSDLLRLEPGGKESFQFRGAVCDEIDHTIVTAVAAVR